MRIEEKEIYTIDELSEEAQENAHIQYLSEGFEYFWIDEGFDSIKAFADLFGVTLTDWSISTYRPSFITTDASQESFRDIKPSGIPKDDLTGYCVDYNLLNTFHETVKVDGDVKGAFEDAMDNGLKAILEDMEHQESLEYFLEHAESNQYEYDIEGNWE